MLAQSCPEKWMHCVMVSQPPFNICLFFARHIRLQQTSTFLHTTVWDAQWIVNSFTCDLIGNWVLELYSKRGFCVRLTSSWPMVLITLWFQMSVTKLVLYVTFWCICNFGHKSYFWVMFFIYSKYTVISAMLMEWIKSS